jgi:hypothetical protein|tara:strand:+ start:797 stop:1030 length:234 start_codon:yes stop_codon:yes gene_type:complete
MKRKYNNYEIADIGSRYNINHKEWILTEITLRGMYVLQHENIKGTYQTMRLTESEMNNIIRTMRIWSDTKLEKNNER